MPPCTSPGEAGAYRYPEHEDCIEIPSGPVPLYRGDSDEYVDQWMYHALEYHGLIVEFSIEQQALGPDGWEPVYRVDTTHGTVHEHHFAPGGIEIGAPRLVYVILPAEMGGYREVDGSWDQYLERVTRYWVGRREEFDKWTAAVKDNRKR